MNEFEIYALAMHGQPVYVGSVELIHIGFHGWSKLIKMTEQVSSSREHQISLQMVVSHHVIGGNWTQDWNLFLNGSQILAYLVYSKLSTNKQEQQQIKSCKLHEFNLYSAS